MTREEERIYDGDCGWANQTCIRILVRLGELFNAEKLIPIDSAHVSGVSYKTLGDAPIEFLRALADAGRESESQNHIEPAESRLTLPWKETAKSISRSPNWTF